MTIERLHTDPDYHLLMALHHDEVLPFVQEELKRPTFTVRFFIGLNIMLIFSLFFFAFQDTLGGLIGWGKLLLWFSLGTVLVFLLLIPPHEVIHGMAYRLVGAPRVSYGVNWQKFYFYAVADQFVVKRKPFIFIGLAPFVVISLLVVLTIFLVGTQMKWLLFGVLFMHTAACAGDFALLSFYERHRNFSELFTYDDVGKHISFFYVKEK